MEENKCFCPHCQQDITALVRELIAKQIEQKKTYQHVSPERRAQALAEGGERLKMWRQEKPEEVKKQALKASKARTAESFARQKETVKETLIKKQIKFAELLFEAKEQGKEITHELETALLQKATQIIKEENIQAKKLAREKAKQEKKLEREKANQAKRLAKELAKKVEK